MEDSEKEVDVDTYQNERGGGSEENRASQDLDYERCAGRPPVSDSCVHLSEAKFGIQNIMSCNDRRCQGHGGCCLDRCVHSQGLSPY